MSKKHSPASYIVLGILLLALIVVLVLLSRAEKRASEAVPAAVTEVSSPLPQTPVPSSAPESTAAPSVTPEPTAEPEATPEPEPEYFTISMIGDCTLSASPDKLGWGIGFQMTVGDDYTYPFANTADLLDDDYVTIGNLECCLSDNSYSSIEQFTFLSRAAYANVLSEGSVEFVTLANNHTRDFGDGAYNDTKAALDAVGVTCAGEDECFLYQTGDGLKLGIYCLYNRLTGNAMSLLSADAQRKLAEESKALIDAGLRSLQEQGAEYTLACLHMGTEGNYETTDVQVELCRYAIDAGFGSVYCTHAHRLQPAEIYGDGIIFYGLGNWIFGGHTNPGNGGDPAAYDTGIAQITVKRTGSRAVLDSYGFIPCSISSTVDPSTGSPGVNTVNNYQPTPYTEGSEAYQRAMSILGGTYEGANYAVGNYWDILAAMNG